MPSRVSIRADASELPGVASLLCAIPSQSPKIVSIRADASELLEAGWQRCYQRYAYVSIRADASELLEAHEEVQGKLPHRFNSR